METHVRTLGVFSIIYGAAVGAAAFALLIGFGGFAGLYGAFDEPVAGILVCVTTGLHAVTAIPALIGGLGILRYHSWARVLLIVTSGLETLTFPLGTVLGLYGLWVLLTEEVEPLFAEAPPQYAAKKSRPPGRSHLRSSTTGLSALDDAKPHAPRFHTTAGD